MANKTQKRTVFAWVIFVILCAVTDIIAGYHFGKDLLPNLSNLAEAAVFVVALAVGMMVIFYAVKEDDDDNDSEAD